MNPGAGPGPAESPALERGFPSWDAAFRVAPLGLVRGEAARALIAGGAAAPLCGGDIAFTAVEILARSGRTVTATRLPVHGLAQLAAATGRNAAAQLERECARLAAPRPPWAGFILDRPLVMGVVNVTPDSFSDGGAFLEADAAVAHGRALLAAGADILDVGGESTRPGAEPTAPEVERARVVPVVRGLASAGAIVSIDTRRAEVMAAAIAAGARIVNDVTALADPAAPDLVARAGAAVVLMHMQGEPQTMQQAPAYDLASLDILAWLEERIEAAVRAGIPRAAIAVDPGIGFGKTLEHNLEILGRLGLYHLTGCPVVLGASRKSFIGRLGGGADVRHRLGGSLAAALAGAAQGVQILRVHDVAETVQALAVAAAIGGGEKAGPTRRAAV